MNTELFEAKTSSGKSFKELALSDIQSLADDGLLIQSDSLRRVGTEKWFVCEKTIGIEFKKERAVSITGFATKEPNTTEQPITSSPCMVSPTQHDSNAGGSAKKKPLITKKGLIITALAVAGVAIVAFILAKTSSNTEKKFREKHSPVDTSKKIANTIFNNVSSSNSTARSNEIEREREQRQGEVERERKRNLEKAETDRRAREQMKQARSHQGGAPGPHQGHTNHGYGPDPHQGHTNHGY